MGKSTRPFLVFNQLDIFTYQVRPDSDLCFDFSLPVDKSHLEEMESEKEDEEVAKNCPTKENVRDVEEDYGEADKEEENEDEGQCEEAADESVDEFVENKEEPALTGEVQGELEEKLAGEREMASSFPFLRSEGEDGQQMKIVESIFEELIWKVVNNVSVEVQTGSRGHSDPEECIDETELNSSLLLSEKFELSMNGHHDLEVGGEVNTDLVENMGDGDFDEYDNMGEKFLKQLDPDFLKSTRLVVNGIFKGEVLNLKVKKGTFGTYVDWFMVNKQTAEIILNVKGQMTYGFNIGGEESGTRVPGGRAWQGYGYGSRTYSQETILKKTNPK